MHICVINMDLLLLHSTFFFFKTAPLQLKIYTMSLFLGQKGLFSFQGLQNNTAFPSDSKGAAFLYDSFKVYKMMCHWSKDKTTACN